MIDFGGPPSSPFVTEIENNSRSPSKQWRPTIVDEIAEEEIATSPRKPGVHNVEENKENVATQHDATLAKLFASPKKPSTPERAPSVDAHLGSSRDSNLMPPPSTRKVSGSPRKTPRKISRSGANTPRSISRGNSFDHTPAQDPATFQAGLDVRNAMMPTEDHVNVDDTCSPRLAAMQNPHLALHARGRPHLALLRLRPGGRKRQRRPANARRLAAS